MRKPERRRRRGTTITESLRYQLEACCKDGRLEAMVLSDEDGLPLAMTGLCDEVAAKMAVIGARIREFNGTLLEAGNKWDVQMLKVPIEGSQLLVCAVGGNAEQRQRQITRGAAGAARILAA
jgi:hypothetical protein